MSKASHHSKSSEPSQRQLRVGEELRHALADVLIRNEVNEPELERLSITVSEVRVSPDLKHANAYVIPLGGANVDKAMEILGRLAPLLRHHVTKRVRLRVSPKLAFRLDTSFDEAERINKLLKSEAVAKDLES